MPGWELFTVADDLAVAFRGTDVRRWEGLEPDQDHELGRGLGEALQVRTLPRPPGERLATLVTVNDVHFGETVCGHVDAGPQAGFPTFSVEPGEPPYPETMNRAAVAEMAAVEPDAVLVKGDLTNDGTVEEYRAFLDCYGGAFGDRMHHIRGNHDAYRGQQIAPSGSFSFDVPGVRVAVLDTTRPRAANGAVDAEQLEWLDTLAAESDRPVLLFGHHHVWAPTSRTRPEGYYGIIPDDSERLVEIAARRPVITGYFAGHTHRNRVRRFPATGPMPWVEVACVKDFPGVWAEYRIYEGGVLQVAHRIAAPAALAWTERTRHMFGGTYEGYALGRLDDRCFAIGWRTRD